MDERTCLACGTPLFKKPGRGRWPTRCSGCRRADMRAPDAPRCEVGGCEDVAKCRRMCSLHYQRWRTYGTPTPPRTEACLHCSAALDASGDPRRKYCTVECRDGAYRERSRDEADEVNAHRRAETAARLVATVKECAQCGDEFTPAQSIRQKFCSRRCNSTFHRDNKGRQCSADGCDSPTRARGLCARHFRSRVEVLLEEVPCVVCGDMSIKRADRHKSRRVTCGSNVCKMYLRYGKGKRSKEIVGPIVRLAPPTPVTVVQSSLHVWTNGVCAWCDLPFTKPRRSGGTKYCSDQCRRRAARARGRERRGEFWITPVRRLSLYERDKWTCQICNGQVDREAHYLDDSAPSLDHIEPQSHALIPDHSDDNLRTAHRWCNAIRGDCSYVTDADFVTAV